MEVLMKNSLIIATLLGVFILATVPEHALTMGLDVVGKGAVCSAPTMSISGKFTSTGAVYTAGGNCTTTGSLGNSIIFQWSGTGSYSNKTASEKVVVPAAPISQASHPYGTWETIYNCPSDPWLTGATCKVVSAKDDSPENAKALEGQFDYLRSQRPITASVTQPQRDALLAKRDSDLKAIAKAEAEQRRGAEIRQTTPAQMAVGQVYPPTILSPRAGQQFYVHMPVPIRLAPPQGSNATGYVINFQLKDPDPRKNYWIPVWTNISVDASQAQSANGYTGFGPYDAGMAGRFASSPGRWRVNAQVFSPRQSVLSDWVEFVVIPLPANPAAAVRRPLTK